MVLSMQIFQELHFRTPRLEERFQKHKASYLGSLPQHLRSLAVVWAVIRLYGCLTRPQVLSVHAGAFSSWACLVVLVGIGLFHLDHQGYRHTPLLSFCGSCLLAAMGRNTVWDVACTIPGEVAALLSLFAHSADDSGSRVFCRGAALATLFIAAELCPQGRQQPVSFSTAGFAFLVQFALFKWLCELQHNLERTCRELFLLQYRTAAKAQHFRLLLSCLLPAQIVEPYFQRCIRDQAGGLLESPVAQRVSRAGVLFMAISEFANMVTDLAPLELIQFLNRLFTALDDKCQESCGLVKIETVGEVYVVASGIFPDADSETQDDESCSHLVTLVKFGLRARGVAIKNGVDLRMGLHRGPIVAGIIGDKLPRFRLFGDTMNAAARLEQHCPPSKLLASSAAADVIRGENGLYVTEHGVLQMKGIGQVTTYQIDFAASPSVNGFSPPRRRNLQNQPPVARSDSSPNLTKFLMDLPELDLDSPEAHGISTLDEAPPAEEFMPLMSPFWDHLDRGLADPSCISVERLAPGPSPAQQRPVGVTRTKSAPTERKFKIGVGANQIQKTEVKVGGRNLMLETPTGWLSPGRQLAPRSRSVFELARATTTPLPRIREQECGEDEPSEEQLDELRRRADAACARQSVLFAGLSSSPAADQEVQFRTKYIKEMRPGFRRGLVGVGFLLFSCVAATVWAVPPGVIIVSHVAALIILLLGVAFCLNDKNFTWQWMWLQVAPATVASSCVAPFFPEAAPQIVLFLWLLTVSVMKAPGSFVLVPSVTAVCLRLGPLWIFAAAGEAVSAAAVCLVGLTCESLDRRNCASHRICNELLERLRSVAEDLLPPTVVADVRSMRFGAGHGPDQTPASVVHVFETVSVLQTDLVGFTALARTMEAEEVLKMLNDIFGLFDRLVSVHRIFKMETVGDAYICASGLPDFAEGEHRPLALIQLALDMHAAVERYNCKRGNLSLGQRAGVHSGPSIGGVVGTTMQRYHLFGRTLHVVEKLESTAPSGAVHVSEATRKALASSGNMPPRCIGGGLLVLQPQATGILQTSKGEHVPQEEVGGEATYVVWPPEKNSTDRQGSNEDTSPPTPIAPRCLMRRLSRQSQNEAQPGAAVSPEVSCEIQNSERAPRAPPKVHFAHADPQAGLPELTSLPGAVLPQEMRVGKGLAIQRGFPAPQTPCALFAIPGSRPCADNSPSPNGRTISRRLRATRVQA